MKVLFISLGQPDYQCDCLLHGLYSLLGEDLTHTDDYFLMYKDYTTPEQLLNSSGKGFTVWGNLPKYLNDKSDIELKIKNKYFDYIVYGSIRRCKDYLNLVINYYPKNKIAVVDGEDDCILVNTNNIPFFKRELVVDIPTIYPISFSIPEEKIVTNTLKIQKTKFLADYLPSNSGSGYIYQSENDYYNNYKEAYFGKTYKKGGWDCMRHYEILGNYCMPHFENLQNCPVQTMFNFPKKEILEGNAIFESETINDRYYELLNIVFEHTKTYLTTKASAKYLIDTLQKI
jgi:hypothetical protein